MQSTHVTVIECHKGQAAPDLVRPIPPHFAGAAIVPVSSALPASVATCMPSFFGLHLPVMQT